MIIISEMLLIVSAGLCLVNNYWIIFVGRFFWGMTAGALNCYTPAFISEIAPNEYKGPFGVINQLMVTGGIFLTALLGLAIPDEADFKTMSPDSFILAGYFRVFFGLPIVIGLLQILLMCTFFNYESPDTLNKEKKFDDLSTVMGKLFHPNEVRNRVEII